MKLPFVISLPHCSGEIPKRIETGMVLTRAELLDAVDLGTREIFGCMPAERILCAEWSRLVVDLNRPPHQRDAKGPVALVNYHGRSVYGSDAIPDEEAIVQRLSTYYRPYHRLLDEAISKAQIKGLLDCHSLKSIGPPEAPDAGINRKDIILGNNGGPDGERNPLRGGLYLRTGTFETYKTGISNSRFFRFTECSLCGGIYGHPLWAHFGEKWKNCTSN